MKERIDILLVEKGFFETREKAKRAIMAGNIIVNENKVDKAGTFVDEESNIRIKGELLKYVSRGGLKLEKAIKVFGIEFKEKTVIDVGASTGGFTDCALQNGAAFVYSIDVGTNQLDWKLRNNPNVKSIENKHIKDLKLEDINNKKADIIVVDVSFISLKNVICYLKDFISEDGKLIFLIKPQFEVGRENVDKGGIVKDIEKHRKVIENVIGYAEETGFYCKGIDVSPITGTKGNVEYISLFDKVLENNIIDIESVISYAKKMKKGEA